VEKITNMKTKEINNKTLIKFRNLIQEFKNFKFTRFIINHKKIAAIIILVCVIVFLGFYIHQHNEILDGLFRISFLNVALIFILYGSILATNIFITHITIRLCHKKLPIKNSAFLTIYSSVINFFGPLQSGPAVRAVYLKSKLGLKIRDYTYTMLFYYFAYAAINVSLLFIKNLPIFTILGIIVAIFLIILGTDKLGLKSVKKYVLFIFATTVIQIIFVILIYTIELNSINPAAHYNIIQTITYAASANLSLFVSLTPGAIGVREAFLVVSQSIHNISLSSIVAAGIVDRAIYVFFLIVMFLLSSMLHLKNMFVRKHNS